MVPGHFKDYARNPSTISCLHGLDWTQVDSSSEYAHLAPYLDPGGMAGVPRDEGGAAGVPIASMIR